MEVINVACAIILFDDKILVAQRSNTMSMPLKWEFPGGKLTPLENESDCIKREIKEELNIEIELIKRLTPSIYHYAEFSIRLIPFIARYLNGKITLLEHKQFALLAKEQISNLDLAEADIPILNEFLTL